jgi:two-component system sensor histidine kinase VicK
LARAAQGVAEGDLAQTVPESSSIHELTILGKIFNFMTESLRQSDQAKTAFISDVTHELRTPLTVIKGTVETLEDGAIDDLDARGQFLSSLHRETDRLIRLVNDLLVLTRADAGALNLHFQSLDLLALARERCNQLDLHARQRNINLIVTEEMPLSQRSAKFLIRGDTDRLAQILDNLIDNAIRYAPPASTITVSLSRTNMEISCRVTDCGEGIPAKHIPLIFERFYRADSGRDRAQGGAGLGLAIVRSLVQAHGGRVSVESVEGQGATFSVCFPALD